MILLLLLLPGCLNSDSKPSPGPTTATDIRLNLFPSPPVALETTHFLVTVPRERKTESGRRVAIDLTMPGMYHGENRPPCVETDPGEYFCKGYLVMSGRWQVVVEVDGEPRRTFYVDAVEKKAARDR